MPQLKTFDELPVDPKTPLSDSYLFVGKHTVQKHEIDDGDLAEIMERQIDELWASSPHQLHFKYLTHRAREELTRGWARVYVRYDSVQEQYAAIVYRSNKGEIAYQLDQMCPDNPALKKLIKRLERQRIKIEGRIARAEVYSDDQVGMF